MILFYQIPLVDTRSFVKGGSEFKLAKPNWPSPSPYYEFIRSFGEIRPRGKGGLSGWVGESEICSAKKAIKLKAQRKAIILENKTNKKIRFKCASRHFYHDGYTLGKFELVFTSIPFALDVSHKLIFQIIELILCLPVSIKSTDKCLVEKKLFDVRKDLAQLYLYSSSLSSNREAISNKKWVIAAPPDIFIECGIQDKISTINRAIKNFTLEKYQIELGYWWHRCSTRNIRIWLLKHGSKDRRNLQIGRQIRLYIQRLHAECECLRSILGLIKTNEISLNKGTWESEFLQNYLNEATRKISKINRKANTQYGVTNIEDIVYESLDVLTPGSRDQLLRNLQQIRCQVLRKIEDMTGKMINKIPHNIISMSSLQGDVNIMSNNSGDTFNAPVGIGKLTDSSSINANTIAGSVYNDKSNSIDEVTTEVRQILENLSQSYPANTIVEKAVIAEKAKEHIEKNPNLKEKIIKAAKVGGLASFGKLIDNPIATFFVEAIKSWLET